MTRESINIEKLIADIKACETAYRQARWREYCQEKEMGRSLGGGKYFFPKDYAEHVTSLYTLRAFVRGKMHRQNPPEPIRQRNAHYGRPEDHGWDAEEHNRKIAEKAAESYPAVLQSQHVEGRTAAEAVERGAEM